MWCSHAQSYTQNQWNILSKENVSPPPHGDSMLIRGNPYETKMFVTYAAVVCLLVHLWGLGHSCMRTKPVYHLNYSIYVSNPVLCIWFKRSRKYVDVAHLFQTTTCDDDSASNRGGVSISKVSLQFLVSINDSVSIYSLIPSANMQSWWIMNVVSGVKSRLHPSSTDSWLSQATTFHITDTRSRCCHQLTAPGEVWLYTIIQKAGQEVM